MPNSLDSFNSHGTLRVGDNAYGIHRLDALASVGHVEKLPYSHRVLLENLLRREDGSAVSADDIEALASWTPGESREQEISFMPARVLLQDLTGVPAVVDLAAMRDAMRDLGGDPGRINPLVPADLVIDHSVQVDAYGSAEAFEINARMEMARSKERYGLLRWAQGAFSDVTVMPPDAGIVHQVNLEYLASVIVASGEDGAREAYPDTLVGLDSHTTMINGLGVLGWGVGGIEAEAAMLGQPVSMLIPDVVGFRLTGRLPEGTTATDLVLMATQMLREKGVVAKFVEFYGEGLSGLPLATRATIANMAPEYGATCGYFPVDEETLAYLRLTGRDDAQVQLVEAYCKEQGLFRTDDSPEPLFADTLSLDLSTVEPSLAGPKRPQDRIGLSHVKQSFEGALEESVEPNQRDKRVAVTQDGSDFELGHGSIVIAAITSCTNTSNPDVMVAAGLLAKKALDRGLRPRPWVKSSLAPGSKVVIDYLEETGLLEPLQQAGFFLVGYGCTTCIGNSGPLPDAVAAAVSEENLVAAAVLSGNRNFEGRVHAHVRANYLASPPLVVAFALAGRIDIDLASEPIGEGSDGPVYLRDIWPSQSDIQAAVQSIRAEMFREGYAHVFDGTEEWRNLPVAEGRHFDWQADSTYVRLPPYFAGLTPDEPPLADIAGARVLVAAGDSVTTDHISPAGSIAKDSPAADYLRARGVEPADFNTYGARRGNHEVMMRGTFANVRFRNLLAPGTEGPWTQMVPGGEQVTLFDAAQRYREEGTPLIVIAGKEYGTGSSRDWAAKGPALLGVRAVITRSFERIHRSNLIGMGLLPLQFVEGESMESLGLTGRERYDLLGIAAGISPRQQLTVRATADDPASGDDSASGDDGGVTEFSVVVRIETPVEVEYYRHGGILPYVLRQLAAGA